MNQVIREEKKFLINVADASTVATRVSKVMQADPHNGTHGYLIRSLYFDTPYDTDYHEKQAGIEVRRKVRLRCYGLGQKSAKLELKQKEGPYQRKRSLTIARADAEQLVAGNYSVLLGYPDDFAAEMFGIMHMKGYRPKTIVEYNRKAFIARENKIRVTFDSRIMATEACFDLFSERLNMYPVIDPYDVVLEVKYNGFLLSYIQQLLNSVDKSELSVSKYILARQHGYLSHL